MRKLLSPRLPNTHDITDSAVRRYAEMLNIELDGLKRDLNKYVGRLVVSTYSSSDTLNADDELVLASGTITITLPPATNTTGKVYYIKNTDTGVVTIDGDGSETIDGETTQTVNQYECTTIVSDGTEWHII